MIPLYVSENGTYRAEQGYAFDPVVVNVQEEEFAINIDIGDYTTETTYAELLENKDKKIKINLISEETILASFPATVEISGEVGDANLYYTVSFNMPIIDKSVGATNYSYFNKYILTRGATDTDPLTAMEMPIEPKKNVVIQIAGTIDFVNDQHNLHVTSTSDQMTASSMPEATVFINGNVNYITVQGTTTVTIYTKALYDQSKLVGFFTLNSQWYKITITNFGGGLVTVDLWLDEETKYAQMS